jgi:hypothetical protein
VDRAARTKLTTEPETDCARDCTAKGVAKFLFAIVSVVAASIVQKLAVLILHVALLRRRRSFLAVALESILR